MPQYLHPGVYVMEVAFDPQPIEGISTSTRDLIGNDIIAPLERLVEQATPAWTECNDNDPGVALLELLAWIAEELAQRMGHIPEGGTPHARRLAAAGLSLARDRTVQQTNSIKQILFFEGQLIDDENLRSERAHDRQAHGGAGIVRGLQVSVNQEGHSQTVCVSPGYAIDGRGREIKLERSVAVSIPLELKDASVVARPKRSGLWSIMLRPMVECEFLVVDELSGEDFSLARLKKSSRGWRLAAAKRANR